MGYTNDVSDFNGQCVLRRISLQSVCNSQFAFTKYAKFRLCEVNCLKIFTFVIKER